ncbi:TPA: polysaccharide polymerase Cap8K [Streptococcus pneumoniae]
MPYLNNVPQNKFSIRLFDIAIVLLTLKMLVSSIPVFDFVFPQKFQNILVILGYILIFLHIFEKRKYTLQFIISIILITTLLLYTSIQMQNYVYFTSWFMLIGTIHYDLRRVIKIIFIVSLSIMFISIFISLLMYIIDYKREILINIRRNETVRAFTFGFIHPNKFTIVLSNLCLMFIWLIKDRLKYYHVTFCLFIQLFFYFFTQTRTALLVSIVIFALLYIYMFVENLELRWIGYSFFCISTFLGVLAFQFYPSNNKFSIFIDNILTGRIKLAAYARTLFGYTFWGQYVDKEIVWDPIWGLTSFTFDSFYSFLMSNAGIIWLLILSVLFVKLQKYLDNKSLILLLAWSMYAVTETDLIFPSYGFQFLFLSILFTNTSTCSTIMLKNN